MTNALDDWCAMYQNEPVWLSDQVKSLNLPAFISSEIARQIVLELKWNITGKSDGSSEEVMNPRAEYLKAECEKLFVILRQKLELGCAAGGLLIKPYPNPADGHIYFDWAPDWGFYPLAFDGDGNLSDVAIPDVFQEGDTIYTRLERHTAKEDGVHITQKAFKSTNRDSIGREIPLTDVPRWAALAPEATVTNAGGQLFGWFRVAAANNVDVNSPMGASVYAKAVDVIREADTQYSRLLWEYEASEMAIDVDPMVLRPRKVGGNTIMETPKLNERLFRGVDLGEDDTYHVFAPAIRDAALVNGLNQLFIRIEDLCGLSRGTISDANQEARTATELRIVKQRSYATIHDNQVALEHCLKAVIRAMDVYATAYNLAPPGDYDVSFDWDDSIVTDTDQQLNERLMLLNAGILSKAEFREWFFGETPSQAQQAVAAVAQENMASMEQILPTLQKTPDWGAEGVTEGDVQQTEPAQNEPRQE